jgi:P-type Cu2+ transporter
MQAATLPSAFAGPPADGRAAAPDAMAALDERAEWETFSRPVRGREGVWESYLAIEGMYCPGCSLTIEQALQGLPGVHEVQVSGATATARLVWSPQHGRPSQWLQALQRAGYRGLPAGDQLAAVPRRQAQRMLLWRWLVAGFCMMQVMMYAFPAYVAAPGEMTDDVAALLRWAAWLLTLPVLLFSCRPFFASAWRDVRHARIGMDVPVALGILIAFGASTAATFDAQGPLGAEVWYDSVTMFVFFLLSGRLLEQRLRDRTAGALETLMRRLPDTVERIAADGSSERIPVRRVRTGDRIRLHAGEVFPADGSIAQGETQVDEALLTGESTPIARRVGDAVIAGSANLGGTVVVAVERTGDATRYGQIVALMERASVEKPAIARLADRFASPFLGAVLLAAAAAAWWWWPQGPGHALGVAIAVLIVTHRDLSVRAVAGNACRDARGVRCTRASRHPGAPPRSARSGRRGGHGRLRQDRHAHDRQGRGALPAHACRRDRAGGTGAGGGARAALAASCLARSRRGRPRSPARTARAARTRGPRRRGATGRRRRRAAAVSAARLGPLLRRGRNGRSRRRAGAPGR